MHHGTPSVGQVGNTYVALSDATANGFSIKTDIQVTSDGVVVTFHDPCLDPLTNGTGSVGR
jgi:glycerophosphoryl diester phosphodiesterase